MGYQLPVDGRAFDGEGNRIHAQAYHDLRAAVKAHFWSAEQPILSELPKPAGARQWAPSAATRAAFARANEELEANEERGEAGREDEWML